MCAACTAAVSQACICRLQLRLQVCCTCNPRFASSCAVVEVQDLPCTLLVADKAVHGAQAGQRSVRAALQGVGLGMGVMLSLLAAARTPPRV
jgi:hypothetical protein